MGHSVPQGDRAFVCLMAFAGDDSIPLRQYGCFEEEEGESLSLMTVVAFGVRKHDSLQI